MIRILSRISISICSAASTISAICLSLSLIHICQTQKNFFGEPLIGIGVDSGDLGFPSMEKLAWAYGFPYVAIHGNKELGEKVEETLAMDGPVICEVFVTLDQNFEPKSAAKRLPDGTLVSPPLEDLSPFLPDEEMDRIMLIPRIKK